jgi:hypothetical protein
MVQPLFQNKLEELFPDKKNHLIRWLLVIKILCPSLEKSKEKLQRLKKMFFGRQYFICL